MDRKAVLWRALLLLTSSMVIVIFRGLILKIYDLALIVASTVLLLQIVLTLLTFKWGD